MPLPQSMKGLGKTGFEKGTGKGFGKGKGKGDESGKGKGKGKTNEFRTFSAQGFDPSHFKVTNENLSYNSSNNTIYAKLTHNDENIKGVSVKIPSLVCENSLQFVKDYNGQINVKTNDKDKKYNSDCYLQLRITPYFINHKEQESIGNINMINKNINTFNKFHENMLNWLKKELVSLYKRINAKKFEKKDDDPNMDHDILKLTKKEIDSLQYLSPTFQIKAYAKNDEEYNLEFFKPKFVYEEDISSTNHDNYDGTGKFNVFFKKNAEKFGSTNSTFNPLLDENNLKGFMVSTTIQIQGIWINLTNKTFCLKIKTKTFEVEPKLHPKYQLQNIGDNVTHDKVIEKDSEKAHGSHENLPHGEQINENDLVIKNMSDNDEDKSSSDSEDDW